MSTKKLLIVAGESSGELYGALLAKYLIKDFEIFGIGGKHMQEAGVNLIGEITHAFGLFEIISHLKKIQENMKVIENKLKKVDGVILIDFPDFNLKVASKAKKLGKKILYYVSPQIWAWRKARVKIIKKYVDYMAVILPFEENIYKKFNIPVKYVGHPMYELMKKELEVFGINKEGSLSQEEKRQIREKFRIKNEIVITLMPGSRPSEIKRIIPLMLNLIEHFDREKIHFVIPKAPNIEFSEEIKKQISKKDNITLLNEQSFLALAMSDAALITSGTSTLQSTLLHVPTVVVYKVNPLSYFIGKILIRGVKHIALPNVIADFLINTESIRVPEFIQDLSLPKIYSEINRILYDNHYREETVNFLSSVSKYFYKKEASKEVYTLCKELFY
jgi:lipid-A-disaccharide synthase